MTVTELARPAALTQPVYEPGKPIEDVARELGLEPDSILKLASNENPLGPSPKAMDAVRTALATAQLYPDGGCIALRDKLSRGIGLPVDHIIIGNGSNEILELLGHAFLGPGADAVMGSPAFIVYKLVTLLFSAKPIEVPLVTHRHDLDALARAVTPATRLVFLPSPNNPTGTANSAAEIEAFVRGLPEHCIFVFDEAYAEFLASPPDLTPLIREGRKVICLRTFSKIYGLAGLRIGYGYGHPEIISVLQRVRQPFNVNALAQAAAIAALEDEVFVARSRETNRAGLAQLVAGCAKLGLETVPSDGNFLMARVGDGVAAFQAMQRNGVIVRPLRPYGMPEWVRITVGTSAHNERVLSELAAWVK
jgi:histidinol-phosphate aminotransferase